MDYFIQVGDKPKSDLVRQRLTIEINELQEAKKLQAQKQLLELCRYYKIKEVKVEDDDDDEVKKLNSLVNIYYYMCN